MKKNYSISIEFLPHYHQSCSCYSICFWAFSAWIYCFCAPQWLGSMPGEFYGKGDFNLNFCWIQGLLTISCKGSRCLLRLKLLQRSQLLYQKLWYNLLILRVFPYMCQYRFPVFYIKWYHFPPKYPLCQSQLLNSLWSKCSKCIPNRSHSCLLQFFCLGRH